VLRRGRLGVAGALVAVSTAVASYNAAQFARDVSVQEIMFGERRSPAITALVDSLGRDIATVVLYLLESAWNVVAIAIALGPVFLWLLGSTAVHAAARMSAGGRGLIPMLVFFGYATALTRVPADLAAALWGGERGGAPALASLAAVGATIWFALLAWHAVRAHYAVDGQRAAAIMAVALVLFYLVPLILILAAAIAIIVVALALEYFPERR
jgi:hypothetical protein